MFRTIAKGAQQTEAEVVGVNIQTNIDNLVVDVKLPVNATLDRQIKNDETVIHTPKQEIQESEKE